MSLRLYTGVSWTSHVILEIIQSMNEYGLIVSGVNLEIVEAYMSDQDIASNNNDIADICNDIKR